jgi:RNA-binding protein
MNVMALVPKEKQILKGKAHKLRPIVFIGHQGLTDAVKKEADRALYDHELIKIRIQAEDREMRREFFTELCEALAAEEVQLIGNIGVVYRKSDK